MRTIDELVDAALAQRREAIEKCMSKWPAFQVSQEELCLLKDQPLDWQRMMGGPHQLCGLDVTTS